MDTAVHALEVHVFTVPTEQREADGTLARGTTTRVVVHASASGAVGLVSVQIGEQVLLPVTHPAGW